ncbi:hypothetical protein SAMN04490357_0009 [Streptomyces misionensis]|uniref:Uncharacterized protein n=1 Tax=Streptomyces misionensis TaxID=67331 RepID=A0A1H4I6D9_9ACTN|nr:hypothetical protein [Streptomyces misionensis]SEB29501.1 hypothetical protein SAMN04490357_0009 [Streptomyces misionensis]
MTKPKPHALTVGMLREMLADPAIEDATPVVIHAEILDGEYVSVLRLESVGTDWGVQDGVRQVVLTAGLGDGETMRKPPLSSF